MPATQRITADEYLALPYSEDLRWAQLIEGEVVVDVPLLPHQAAAGELLYALGSWTRSGEGRGLVTLPLDVKLDEGNVFQPDLLWYPEGAEPGRHAARPYPLPHLAVEVRSPSTWRYDTGAKKQAYERAGLRELWLVDTDRSRVLVSGAAVPERTLGRADVLTSPQLDGFELPLSELFPE